MLIKELSDAGLITPPSWLPTNIHYLTMMGSVAYGVSSDTSDCDLYGFAIPPKNIVFSHLQGAIQGFGRKPISFDNYQKHHVKFKEKLYDMDIYSIVRFFHLCAQNNPNMIDSLYTPRNCVIYTTQIGELVREKRDIFLHKGAWHRFKGYAYGQMHKIQTKNPQMGSKRAADVAKHGFDTKFAYHVVRLMLEAEQILTNGTIDLQLHREQLKAIRRGEWTEAQIKEFFDLKEKELEVVYNRCKLPYGPREDEIKELLLQCLEIHYGSLKNVIAIPGATEKALREIMKIAEQALPK